MSEISDWRIRLGGVKKRDPEQNIANHAKIYMDSVFFEFCLSERGGHRGRESNRMDDQANRPHRKTKEKKKKAHGGKVLACSDGRTTLIALKRKMSRPLSSPTLVGCRKKLCDPAM